MKIIGVAGDDKFIIEATRDELANIAGLTHAYNSGLVFQAGTQIRVNDIYRHLININQSAQELRSARGKLLELADQLVPVVALVRKPQELRDAKAPIEARAAAENVRVAGDDEIPF